jgi:hypothetical protein
MRQFQNQQKANETQTGKQNQTAPNVPEHSGTATSAQKLQQSKLCREAKRSLKLKQQQSSRRLHFCGTTGQALVTGNAASLHQAPSNAPLKHGTAPAEAYAKLSMSPLRKPLLGEMALATLSFFPPCFWLCFALLPFSFPFYRCRST